MPYECYFDSSCALLKCAICRSPLLQKSDARMYCPQCRNDVDPSRRAPEQLIGGPFPAAPEGVRVPRPYWSKAVVGAGGTGWIVAWSSNQLVTRIPQWPNIRVHEGQELTIRIDPAGGGFGLRCDTDPALAHVMAVIEPDEQPHGKCCEWLLIFRVFQH